MPTGGPQGPLVPYLLSFVHVLSELGYTRRYLGRHLMLVARFSNWLGRRHVDSHSISHEHVARYLRERHRDRAAVRADSVIFDQLMIFLRTKRVIPQPTLLESQLSPAESYARAYERYLREDRGLAKVTIIYYIAFSTDFLKDRFGSGPINSRLWAPKTLPAVGRSESFAVGTRLSCWLATSSFVREQWPEESTPSTNLRPPELRRPGPTALVRAYARI
jgi:hypothetical protein